MVNEDEYNNYNTKYHACCARREESERKYQSFDPDALAPSTRQRWMDGKVVDFSLWFSVFYDQCRLHSESENQNTEWNLHQRAEYSRHMRVVCSIALQLRLHFN